MPSRSNDIESMVDFVNDNLVGDFEHLIDNEGVIWSALDIFDQPAFAFVNDDGTVEVNVGSFEEAELAERVQALIDA